MMVAGNNFPLNLLSLVLEPLLRGGGRQAGMNRRQTLTKEAGMAAPDGASAAFSCRCAA